MLNELADRYMRLVLLGESEYTSTYLGRDSKTDTTVVLRFLTPEFLLDGPAADLIESEAAAATRLKHSHIIRVLDSGRADGEPFYVTEYAEGGSLAARLSAGELQDCYQVYSWLFDIAEALDFIHAKGKTHREVRAANIFIDDEEEARITDFVVGGARGRFEGGEARHVEPVDRPGFVAPEVEAGGAYTPASDQYALAALVYLATVGMPPLGSRDDRAAALRERLTEEGTEDVLRALSDDPAERFPSCYEFARSFGVERKRGPNLPAPALPRIGAPAREPARLPPPIQPAAFPAPVPAPRRAPRPAPHPAPIVERSSPMPPVPVATSSVTRTQRTAGAAAPARGGMAGRCWRLRLGHQDRYARTARDGDFIAIGWEQLGDLAWVAGAATPDADLQRLVGEYEAAYDVSGLRSRNDVRQLWQFVSGMEVGDLVLVPNAPEDLVHLGRIDGAYEYVLQPPDDCSLRRRRQVTWLRDVAWDEIPNGVARSLSGRALLGSLDHEAEALNELASDPDGGQSARSEEKALLATIVASLQSAAESDFQALLRALFGSMEYDAALMPGTAEDCYEAAGTMSVHGLVEVDLRMWIHRSRQAADIDTVHESRAGLGMVEHGVLSSLAGFTQRARAEAAAAGKKPIRLVDGETLAALALEHWDGLPDQARQVLGVTRSEQTTVEIRFVANDPD